MKCMGSRNNRNLRYHNNKRLYEHQIYPPESAGLLKVNVKQQCELIAAFKPSLRYYLYLLLLQICALWEGNV